MSVFDLATNGRRAADEDARLRQLRLEDVTPGAWQGSTDALKGLLRPSAAAGRTLMMAGAPVPMAVDAVSTAARDVGDALDAARAAAMGAPWQVPDRTPITAAQDWYFGNVVDELGSSAVDHWTPDPEAMGGAAKAVNLGANVIGTLPQLFGTPSLFLAQSGIDPATDLVRKGVDADTAALVGGVNLAANAVGMRLPAAWGNTLTQRIATGAGANLGLGATADAASAGALEASGYRQQAAGFDPADPYARALDVLMGAAFGYKAHIDAPVLLAKSQRDAVLTARNNDHLHRQTLPGEPASPRAAMAHANALSDAIGQVLRGEPVNVADAINPADFMLRTEIREAMAPAGPDYSAYVVALESSGRANARASTSSATGLHQFTDGTWLRTVRAAQPGWAQGLNDAELLALRTDPAKSTEMELALRDENATALERAGQPVTVHHLYAAHHFGAGRGVEFARAADDTPMSKILSPEQLAANGYLRGKTKAQAIAEWDARAERAGVAVPESAIARTVEATPAARFDGPGAGRVIDERLATLNTLSQRGRLAREEVDALLREDAELVAVMRDSEQAARTELVTSAPRGRLTPEEIEFASARRVEIRQALEQHRAAGAYESQLTQLQRRLDKIDSDADLVRLAERLAGLDDAPARAPRQETEDPARTDTPGATPARRPAQPAAFAAFGEGALDSRPGQPAARALPGAGTAAATRLATTSTTSAQAAVSAPAAASTRQQGAGQGDAARARPAQAGAATIDETLRVVTENPGLQVIDGFDADGNPRYRAASEVLADIEAERAREANDAQAFPAAVSCFLRMGS